MDYKVICDKVRKVCPGFRESDAKKGIKEILLTDYQSETMVNVAAFFWTHNEEKFAQELLFDIFCGSSGKLYETMVYGWLIEHSIPFIPQPQIPAEDCFKKSAAHYNADGQLARESPVVFDIKQFGIGATHLKDLERFLMDEFPEYLIQVGGTLNCSSNEIEKGLLSKKADIVNEIRNQIESGEKYCIVFSPSTFKNIEIRCVPRSRGVSSCVSSLDITEWAKKNRFYSLGHSSQFCINTPYIIFYPFDQSLDPHLSNADDKDVAWQLRLLCRRMFMELPRIHDRFISDFDGKAKNGVSVASASKKVSAVVFLDVTAKHEYHSCRMWAFVNPNADNPLYSYQVHQWFKLNGAFVDDFQFDNY